jgi:hypothetical protein
VAVVEVDRTVRNVAPAPASDEDPVVGEKFRLFDAQVADATQTIVGQRSEVLCRRGRGFGGEDRGPPTNEEHGCRKDGSKTFHDSFLLLVSCTDTFIR